MAFSPVHQITAIPDGASLPRFCSPCGCLRKRGCHAVSGSRPAATPTETPASTASETPAPVPHGHIDPSLSIDTDGAVRLSLDFADANKDTANNTWWWPVERKPFSGGDTRNSYKDRLMARIYLPHCPSPPQTLPVWPACAP